MWFFVQSLTAFAVMAANVHYQWTPNGYLAALLGFGAAWLVTRMIYWAAEAGRAKMP